MIRTSKGFTLIELMVVIVIIGVLAALAIPKFMDAATKAKMSEIPTVVGSWDHAVLGRLAEVGALPTVITDLVFEEPTSKWFTYTGAYVPATSTMTADVATGKRVGTYAAGAGDATSIATLETGAIAHSNGTFDDKYLPNFEDAAAAAPDPAP